MNKISFFSSLSHGLEELRRFHSSWRYPRKTVQPQTIETKTLHTTDEFRITITEGNDTFSATVVISLAHSQVRFPSTWLSSTYRPLYFHSAICSPHTSVHGEATNFFRLMKIFLSRKENFSLARKLCFETSTCILSFISTSVL